MTVRFLKTHPSPFADVLVGTKTFEVRLNDRGFQVGDVLVLQEWIPQHEGECWMRSPYDEQQTDRCDWKCSRCGRGLDDPMPGAYAGREVRRRVTYILEGAYGLPVDVCVMALVEVDDTQSRAE